MFLKKNYNCNKSNTQISITLIYSFKCNNGDLNIDNYFNYHKFVVIYFI